MVLRQAVSPYSGYHRGVAETGNEVNRPNFTLAPALSLLLNDEANLDGNLSWLKQMDIKDLLISVPKKDIHNQLWNTNAPVYKSGQTETIRKILSVFPDAHYIMDGLYNSQDEEYLDGKRIRQTCY